MTLYIIRGLPGSGKTTLAKQLVHSSRHAEADQFFELNGPYKFDPAKVGDAHTWCQNKVRALLKEHSNCCVSNTFVRRWEYQPYIDMALEFNHEFQVIEVHGPWDSVHGVPKSAIKRMRDRWEPYLQ
jgi:tRNA uridine 5-carbamoylmethylation protein Kti12